MSRDIILSSSSGKRAGPGDIGQPSAAVDSYTERLLKLIPLEVVGLYIALDGIISNRIKADPTSNDALALTGLTFAIGVIGTGCYLKLMHKVKSNLQIIVSMLAFCSWAIYIGTGFRESGLISTETSAVVLVTFSFFAPMVPAGTNR